MDILAELSIALCRRLSRQVQEIKTVMNNSLLNGPLSQWLDHLRWLSALAVAAGHLRNLLFKDAPGLDLTITEKVFYFFTLFTTQAVVIFFVASGLLIGGSILRGAEPKRYAIDRISRLYVVLIPALLLTFALQFMGLSIECGETDGLTVLISNLTLTQIFFDNPPCNNHSLWSLSSEAYCYIVAPFAIVAVVRRSVGLGLIFLALLLPAIIVFEVDNQTPIFTLGLWFSGLLPWFLRVRVSPLVAAIPFATLLVLGRMHVFPSQLVEEACIAASLAFLLCSDLQKLSAPFAKQGKLLAGFSYSLYLLQMPLSQAAASIFGAQGLNNDGVGYFIYFTVLILILFIAYGFGKIFEDNTQIFRTKLRRLAKIT